MGGENSGQPPQPIRTSHPHRPLTPVSDSTCTAHFYFTETKKQSPNTSARANNTLLPHQTSPSRLHFTPPLHTHFKPPISILPLQTSHLWNPFLQEVGQRDTSHSHLHSTPPLHSTPHPLQTFLSPFTPPNWNLPFTPPIRTCCRLYLHFDADALLAMLRGFRASALAVLATA